MLQVRNLSITYKKDLRKLIDNFNITFNRGDKVCLIGEEGNGKTTLLKWIYDENLISDYCEYEGQRIIENEKLAYLPQELNKEEKNKTIYEYFLEDDLFLDNTTKELLDISNKLNIADDIFYSDKKLSELSGGELIKIQIARLLISKGSFLLLDEPSNDLDLKTLNFLESFINNFEGIILFISHDETLIENTANRIIHLELLNRKTKSIYTISSLPYKEYIEQREYLFNRQKSQAINDKKQFDKKMERYRHVHDRVEHELRTITRQDPGSARNLKDKMHTVKAMGRRFEKEKENLTKMPSQEEAILLKFDDDIEIANNKKILDLSIDELYSLDHRILSKNIKLEIIGPKKICIIGDNGVGKTTLLKIINDILINREDLNVFYMSQDYLNQIDDKLTPIEYLAPNKSKDEITLARSYLGAMRYTSDEMEHKISNLSGGQKAKLFVLKMNLLKANVLLLDEPTRNFSPLSNPVLRKVLKEYKGVIIAISHDRKFINIFDIIYELNYEGLKNITLG